MTKPSANRTLQRFRSKLSVTLFWVSVVPTAILVGDAAIRGNWMLFFHALPWAALILWVIWALFVRPQVVAGTQTVSVINVGRITEIPWSQIVRIDSRRLLTINLADGSDVSSWGAPAGPRQRPTSRANSGQVTKGEQPLTIAEQLTGLEKLAETTTNETSVVKRLDWLSLGIGIAICLCAAVTLVAQ